MDFSHMMTVCGIPQFEEEIIQLVICIFLKFKKGNNKSKLLNLVTADILVCMKKLCQIMVFVII
jgi:hypothetical protein